MGSREPEAVSRAQIAVGTIDQVLLSNLAVRHAHLRSTALLRHPLIVDQVHASDTYMTSLLELVLAVHLGAGGYALLDVGDARGHGPLPASARPAGEPSVAGGGSGHGLSQSLLGRRRGRSDRSARRDRWSKAGGDGADRGDRRSGIHRRQAAAAARAGAKVLVVGNTVRGAVEVQEALEGAVSGDATTLNVLFHCEGVWTLHHGRFAREDRALLTRQLSLASVAQAADGGIIVVGTQTLEQSLDIDADLLITDLVRSTCWCRDWAGCIATTGRTGRKVTRRRCVVLSFADRDLAPLLQRGRHGLGPMGEFRGVYPDVRVIEATLRLLKAYPEFDIPAMNRMLVEGATHPEELDRLAAELGPAWRDHGNAVAGGKSADRSIAALQTIDRSIPFDELRFAGLEERVHTRFGADSRVIDFVAAGATLPVGPFGKPVRMVTLPEHLCRGIPADAAVSIFEQRTEGFSNT